MTTPLFPHLPLSLSPLAAWQVRHHVQVYCVPWSDEFDPADRSAGDETWIARLNGAQATAADELTACHALCGKLGLAWIH